MASLAGETLTVRRLTERLEIVHTVSDVRSGGTFKRLIKVWGTVKRWTLDCIEVGVTWANSSAKVLQTSAAAGAAVNLTVSEPPTALNLNVFIVGVDVHYRARDDNTRRFTVTVMQDQS